MLESEARLQEADRQLAAVIYLMSCHARTRCPRLAVMVERHLVLIGRNPEAGEHVRDTCRRLASAWVCVREFDERAEAAGIPGPPMQTH